jgi:hypothetical protein
MRQLCRRTAARPCGQRWARLRGRIALHCAVNNGWQARRGRPTCVGAAVAENTSVLRPTEDTRAHCVTRDGTRRTDNPHKPGGALLIHARPRHIRGTRKNARVRLGVQINGCASWLVVGRGRLGLGGTDKGRRGSYLLRSVCTLCVTKPHAHALTQTLTHTHTHPFRRLAGRRDVRETTTRTTVH